MRRVASAGLLVMAVLLLPGCSGTGMDIAAPALEGSDVHGKAIRLSDYRGKVVVVDFWATWCGPCRQMMPHNKALVQKMAGKPFQFLGVSADASLATLREYVDSNGISWPNIFDGRNGPLGVSWQIDYFPTVFVIDHKGVIRYKDLRGRDLERAVEKLVKDADKSSGWTTSRPA